MKKKILSLALVAMTIGAFSATAQNNSGNNTCTVKQCENPEDCRPPKKEKRMNPYEGLNLTDAQKTKLQELDSQKKEARKQKAESRKKEKQERHELKMKNDSIKMAERRAAKQEYLEQVKAIIGPDNYVVFLENFYLNGNKSGKDKPNKDFRPGDGPQDGKFFGKGPGNGPKDGKKKDKGNRKGRKDMKPETENQQASL